MILSLSELIGRARRLGGDRVVDEIEELESEGSSSIIIAAEGFVNVTSISVDGQQLVENIDYQADGVNVTFTPTTPNVNSPLVVGSQIVINYESAVYTDEEIVFFLEDSASDVAGDLSIFWEIDNGELNDVRNILFEHPSGNVRHTILSLLCHRAGLNIRNDINNNAADDAITVRDGATSIDLSKGAQSGERVLSRTQRDYLIRLNRVLTNRFRGLGAYEYIERDYHSRHFPQYRISS